MKDENISLLWQLQKLEEEIDEINKKIELKKIRKKLKELKYEYDKTKKSVENKIVKYKEWEYKLTKIDRKSENANYRIQELQDKIYGGEITNVIALSKLKDELDELKKEMDHLEEDILNRMEEMEESKIDIKDMKESMLKIQKCYKKEKEGYDIKKEKLVNKKNLLSARFQELQEIVDKKYLLDYKRVQKDIKKPMALIKNGTCTGCNMNISIILLKNIKENAKIYLCENCGRILYMEKD